MLRDDRGERRPVGDVGAMEGEARLTVELGEPRLLQRDVVIVVEIVDRDDGVAARQQRLADMEADEAGAPVTRTLIAYPVSACRWPGRSAAQCIA